MANKIETLADEIATAIGGQTFSQTISVSRDWIPSFDLKTMSGFLVSVVPAGQSKSRASRSNLNVGNSIEIGVTKKLTAVTDTYIDQGVSLLQEIESYLWTFRGTLGDRVSESTSVLCDKNKAQQEKTYQGVVTATFAGIE